MVCPSFSGRRCLFLRSFDGEVIRFVIVGPGWDARASSTARTPLAGPAFVFQAEQIQADKLQLYRFDVKNGNREVLVSHKGKSTAKPLRVNVNPLGGGLFKIDVEEHLDNGEYGLTPDGSNQVFCFQVY